MKYVLVSTYPKEGSRNIGDKLIEQSTASAIRCFDPEAEITTVWRAATWESVRDVISSADHVVFACLAIRKNMQIIYPYLSDILDLRIPISVIAAGTSLQVASQDMFNQGFTENDLELLQRVSNVARIFTTRGALTQAFCNYHKLSKATFSGDVAFLDPRYESRQFKKLERVERIVISDPHHGEVYVPVFRALVARLQNLFPTAQIECVLHGVNPSIETVCLEMGLAVHPIHLNPENGLDIYENYDLHVGFRVHGHVSALKRRLPSYLLEQDGRGTDYGLSFSRKMTVPCYRVARPAAKRVVSPTPEQQSLVESSSTTPSTNPIAEKKATRFVALPAAAELLGALIGQDIADGFVRFQGFDKEIVEFNNRTLAAVQKICKGRP
jgi:hypothetical protein